MANHPSDGVERNVANHLGIKYGQLLTGELAGRICRDDVIACIEASEEKSHSPRRHLVEFRQRRIEMVPGVTTHGVRHDLRLVSGGVVEARSVDGEKIGHGRERQVDR